MNKNKEKERRRKGKKENVEKKTIEKFWSREINESGELKREKIRRKVRKKFSSEMIKVLQPHN